MPRLTFALAFQIRLVVTILFASIGSDLVIVAGVFPVLLLLLLLTFLGLAAYAVGLSIVAGSKRKQTPTTLSTPDGIGVDAIRSTFLPIAKTLTVAVTNSDFPVKVSEPPLGAPPYITMMISSGEMEAFKDALSRDDYDATGRFLAVLAHELGHVVYRDHSRLEWLLASMVLPLMLIAVVISPVFTHQVPRIDYSDAVLFLVCIFVLVSAVIIQRNGEYYADAFSSTFLGRERIASVLDRYARQDKYIKYPLMYKLTHPPMSNRAGLLREPRLLSSQAWSIALLTFVYFYCFCSVLPGMLAANVGLFISGMVFAYGIPIMGPILIAALVVLLAWVLFCLVSPSAYLGAELGASVSVAKGFIGGIPSLAVGVVGSVAAYYSLAGLNKIESDGGFGDFFLSMLDLYLRWIMMVSVLIFLSFVFFWLLARVFPQVRSSILLRRKLVAICVVCITCIVVLISAGITNVAVYLIVVCGASALILYSPIVDGDGMTRGGAGVLQDQVAQESVLLGTDVPLFRFMERLGIGIIAAPAWALATYSMYEGVGKLLGDTSIITGATFLAATVIAPFQVYRWMGKQQRRELAIRRLLTASVYDFKI